MPSKPRHGRDYRYRTPQTRNLIQVPGATTGFVNVVDVFQSDSSVLDISFDGDLVANPGDPIQDDWLGLADTNSTAGSIEDMLANLTQPEGVEVIATSPINGLKFIRASYGIPIDPTIHLLTLNWTKAHPDFVGRLMNQFQIQPIHA